MTQKSLIQSACDKVGGQASLARLLGVAPPTVQQWRTGERPVPIERCVAIERATGGEVTRQELRPDDYWLIWPDLPEPKHHKPAKAA